VEKDVNIKQKTRIISISDEAGMPPLVARPGLPDNLKQKILKVIFRLDEFEEGKQVLTNLKIDKFVAGQDESYNGIRQAAKQVVGNE